MLEKRRQTVRQIDVYWLIFVLLAFATSGCYKAPKTGVPAGGSRAGKPAQRPLAPDESLTNDEYVRLGMPALDREWLAKDIADARNVMGAFGEKALEKLPRFLSPYSGSTFAKITSPKNLDYFKDRSIPVDLRANSMVEYDEAYRQIIHLYLAAYRQNKVRDSEMVELAAMRFRICETALDLFDEFSPGISKDDPDYAERMQGAEQMKQEYALITGGGITMLTEYQHHRTGELARLIDHMQSTYPRIVPRLLPSARTEIMTRLETLEADPAAKDLHSSLRQLRLKLKDSLDEAKAK